MHYPQSWSSRSFARSLVWKEAEMGVSSAETCAQRGKKEGKRITPVKTEERGDWRARDGELPEGAADWGLHGP